MAAWPSQEPQQLLQTSCPAVLWGDCGLFPQRVVLLSTTPPDYTPHFCVSQLAGGKEPCMFCGFVPFITMQTIFSCSQGRSGIPALFPGFLLVHEKRKNNEEPVWLHLAKLWADDDVTLSPAMTGCSQTGHALSTHGTAIG